MRISGGIFFALILASGLYAQNRGSVTPTVTGGFGSVVFPGGTPATTPGVTRSFGNLVNPGGGGPHLVVPGGVVPSFARPSNSRPGRRTTTVTTYGYPVYVGGGYSDNQYASEQSAPQQPYFTIVMPPQQTVVMPPQPVTPVIINVGSGGQYGTPAQRQSTIYDAPEQQTPDQSDHLGQSGQAAAAAPAEEPAHYLIAFKDHTIYLAVAYWVDGDTLHYFTAGNTHNQVSISLLDRALTERLNKESGFDFKLAK